MIEVYAPADQALLAAAEAAVTVLNACGGRMGPKEGATLARLAQAVDRAKHPPVVLEISFEAAEDLRAKILAAVTANPGRFSNLYVNKPAPTAAPAADLNFGDARFGFAIGRPGI